MGSGVPAAEYYKTIKILNNKNTQKAKNALIRDGQGFVSTGFGDTPGAGTGEWRPLSDIQSNSLNYALIGGKNNQDYFATKEAVDGLYSKFPNQAPNYYYNLLSPPDVYKNTQTVNKAVAAQNAKENSSKGFGLGNILKIGASLASPFVLGPAGLGLTGAALTGASAAAGAGLGAIGGGGLKGAAIGGLSGGIGASAAGGLGSSFVKGAASKIGSGLGNFSTEAALSGALKGGVGGLLGGDGLSGALKGAGVGGVTGGFAPSISNAIGGTLGKTVSGALTGASGGIASGNAQTAGLGAALGGAGALLQSGDVKIPALGSLPEKLGAGIQGPTRPGSGILGGLAGLGDTASKAGEGLSSLTGGSGVNLGDVLKIGGAFYEDKNTQKNNQAIENALKRSQAQAQGYLSPYLQSGNAANTQLSQALSAGFQPGDLTQDPGYQFRLSEGNKALERRMAASGLGQSGAALKAAQEYGQGLADQTYNDAYQRWLSNNQLLQTAASQGQGAAGSLANVSTGLGGAQAAILADSQESKNKRLSTILGGLGAFF